MTTWGNLKTITWGQTSQGNGMTLGEAKEKALALMAEYSTDGVKITEAENADYLMRMNVFASDAQMEIADKVPIDTSFTIAQTASVGKVKHSLPDDFLMLKSVELDGEPFMNFKLQNRYFVVDGSITGTFELFYHKVPETLTFDTPEAYKFEVDLHVQHLIPYYMGGMAIQDENATLADRLMNIYYSQLAKVKKEQEDYPQTISNVYST